MAKSAEGEIQKLKDLEDRIKAPCIWGRLPCRVRFEDLQDRRYDDAVRFLKNHYVNEEITFRSVKISEDREGLDEFIYNARVWMKDKMSIAAVKEGEDKLVGVLIMRLQEKQAFSRTFSRVKVTYNPVYTNVMKFYNKVEKHVNLYDSLGVRKYFKVYVLALKPRYRHRGIGKEMLRAAIELSKNAGVPAIAGIFQTGRLQQIADELGFQKFNEIHYVRYLIDEKIVFFDTGQGNYGAALMGYRIPSVEEPLELESPSSRFSLQSQESHDSQGSESVNHNIIV